MPRGDPGSASALSRITLRHKAHKDHEGHKAFCDLCDLCGLGAEADGHDTCLRGRAPSQRCRAAILDRRQRCHGSRSGTKLTKTTKATKPFVIFVIFVALVPKRVAWPVSAMPRSDPGSASALSRITLRHKAHEDHEGYKAFCDLCDLCDLRGLGAGACGVA